MALTLLTATVALSATAKVYDPVCGPGKYILTPAAEPAPFINGPDVFGVRPGAPFLYTIPATGQRPIRFSAEGLPDGLTLNAKTGVISGTITQPEKRNYEVTLQTENAISKTSKPFSIVVGDTICLTPPLGWNSWNCWGKQVTQQKVLASAHAMAEKGLINYGWTYINIDDAWQGERGGPHHGIQGNPEKFPAMKTMCDKIHAMGLKVGIYSSPWITTYAGFIGGSSDHTDGHWSLEEMAADKDVRKAHFRVAQNTFDANDALQWADWGIDYLKYDWNPNDPDSTIRMADALNHCGRDIVYSLSNSAPVEHADLYAEKVNCWRTAGDLKDRWDQDGAHLNIIDQWERHRTWMTEGVRGGPGHFPDPDMLVIGDVVENNVGSEPRPSRLTPDEQYAHISLWTLWAAPMLIGCPIENMDDFTLNLLTNSEVLDVHQDSVATPGVSVEAKTEYEIVVKELTNGEKAIGLFNKSNKKRTVTVNWKEANLRGRKQIRDIWRQQDIGSAIGKFSANVPPHGVVLIRVK